MAVSRTTSWHKQAEEIKDLNKARHSTHEMAEQSKAPPPQPLQQPRAQAPHAVGMATLHDAFGWELGAINGASYAVITDYQSPHESVAKDTFGAGTNEFILISLLSQCQLYYHPGTHYA